MELSDRIRAVREEKRIKLIEMATALGVDVSNYAKIEKKGKKLTLERIEEIANALGVPITELLGYGLDSSVQSESDMLKQVRSLEAENERLKSSLIREREEKAVFRNALQAMTDAYNNIAKLLKFLPQIKSVPESLTDEELAELKANTPKVNGGTDSDQK